MPPQPNSPRASKRCQASRRATIRLDGNEIDTATKARLARLGQATASVATAVAREASAVVPLLNDAAMINTARQVGDAPARHRRALRLSLEHAPLSTEAEARSRGAKKHGVEHNVSVLRMLYYVILRAESRHAPWPDLVPTMLPRHPPTTRAFVEELLPPFIKQAKSRYAPRSGLQRSASTCSARTPRWLGKSHDAWRPADLVEVKSDNALMQLWRRAEQ